MSLTVKKALAAAILLLAGIANAHPGDDHHEELMKRAEWLNQVERRGLSHCADKLEARGIQARSHQRRRELADAQRKKRSLASGEESSLNICHRMRSKCTDFVKTVPYLRTRDLATAANTSHLSDLTGLTSDSTDSTIFSGNSSCILNPEVTEGPYCMF